MIFKRKPSYNELVEIVEEIAQKVAKMPEVVECKKTGLIVAKHRAHKVEINYKLWTDLYPSVEYYSPEHAPSYDKILISEQGTRYFKSEVEVDEKGKIK